MKKFMTLILSFALVFSLASCGKKEEKKEIDVPKGEAFFEAVYEPIDADSLPAVMTTEIDLASDDLYLFTSTTGLSDTENVEAVYSSEALISAVPYSFVYIDLKDGADVEDMMNKVSEGIDPNKWICVSAEKTIVNSINSDIILIMASKDTADLVYNSVTNLYGEALGEKPIIEEQNI